MIVESREDLVMMVTRGRIVYRGLLGRPKERTLGGLSIYSCEDVPFKVRIGNAPSRRVSIAMVPSNVPVVITARERVIDLIVIEPERMPEGVSRRVLEAACVEGSPEHRRLQMGFQAWAQKAESLECTDSAVDRYFFGSKFAVQKLDPRITQVADAIAENPTSKHMAADHASRCGLSFSRFLHLFRDEVGMTFRGYCAWKRARAMLQYVAQGYSITEVAMQIGYPDSSHFSHSIRRIYGLCPRDIFSGSQDLAVHPKYLP